MDFVRRVLCDVMMIVYVVDLTEGGQHMFHAYLSLVVPGLDTIDTVCRSGVIAYTVIRNTDVIVRLIQMVVHMFRR
jgi:hypothetical protein